VGLKNYKSMDAQLNRRYAFKYHVNNCRKWAGHISRDHTLQFAGKKGMTASMGSEASGPGERTSLWLAAIS